MGFMVSGLYSGLFIVTDRLFIIPSRFLCFFNDSKLGFHDSRSVFMISGWFLCFFMVDSFLFRLSAGGVK